MSGNNWNSYGGNPRPDVIGATRGQNRSIKEWFNTAAFSYAPYGDFGNAPRYFSNILSPAYNNFDTGIMEPWSLREPMRIQFRAEMFNTFNHPNFFTPNGLIVDAIRIRTPFAPPASDKSPRLFHRERCNGQVNSIGDPLVKMRLKLLLLFILLAISEPGFGQQGNTQDIASYLGAAQEAQARKDYAAAESAYEAAVKVRSDMPEVWANLGLMQNTLGHYLNAIESFRRAIRLKPDLYVPNLFLGIDYIQTNRAQQAIPFLVKAESKRRTIHRLLYHWGRPTWR